MLRARQSLQGQCYSMATFRETTHTRFEPSQPTLSRWGLSLGIGGGNFKYRKKGISSNVSKAIINLPCLDGLYHPFMVNLCKFEDGVLLLYRNTLWWLQGSEQLSNPRLFFTPSHSLRLRMQGDGYVLLGFTWNIRATYSLKEHVRRIKRQTDHVYSLLLHLSIYLSIYISYIYIHSI